MKRSASQIVHDFFRRTPDFTHVYVIFSHPLVTNTACLLSKHVIYMVYKIRKHPHSVVIAIQRSPSSCRISSSEIVDEHNYGYNKGEPHQVNKFASFRFEGNRIDEPFFPNHPAKTYKEGFPTCHLNRNMASFCFHGKYPIHLVDAHTCTLQYSQGLRSCSPQPSRPYGERWNGSLRARFSVEDFQNRFFLFRRVSLSQVFSQNIKSHLIPNTHTLNR